MDQKFIQDLIINANGITDCLDFPERMNQFSWWIKSIHIENQLIIISDKSTIINIELVAKQLDKKIKLEDNVLFKRLSNAKSSDIGIILNSISKR